MLKLIGFLLVISWAILAYVTLNISDSEPLFKVVWNAFLALCCGSLGIYILRKEYKL